MASDPRQDAQTSAGHLVTLARAGDLNAVTGSLTLLSFTGQRLHERLRLILTALIEANASMVAHRARALGLTGTFAANLRLTDDSAFDIDRLTPPVRAAVRALLAQVNGCPQDAADQIELALAGGQRASVHVIVLVLRWTVNSLEWCEDDARPDWLARRAS
jgi:hypothetical protein